MKVTYQPQPGDNDVTEAFGIVFEAGQAVDVKDENTVSKLRGNPMFKVAGDKPDAEDKERDASAQRLDKVLDGRSKAAREARQKAGEAEADAAAKERAERAALEIREAKASGDRTETEFLTNS